MESGFTERDAQLIEMTSPEYVTRLEVMMALIMPKYQVRVKCDGLDPDNPKCVAYAFIHETEDGQTAICRPVIPIGPSEYPLNFVTRSVAFEMTKLLEAQRG